MTILAHSLRPAGLFLRMSAFIVDCTVMVFASWAILLSARAMHQYLQPELTFVLISGAYGAVAALWWRRGIGKTVCGLTIMHQDGEQIQPGRACARALLKSVSAAFLGLGVLWACRDQQRRTWHDRLTATRVISEASRVRSRITVAFALVVVIIGVSWYFRGPVSSFLANRRMAVSSTQQLDAERRQPALLKDVRDLPPSDIALCAQWIADRGREPLAYAIAKAQQHQLLIFGEMHEQGDTLQWFNDSIPALYQDGGVTCIAMEVLLADDNAEIERLVTADSFDREAALRIARHQYWGMWGWKEYWDVLETVWRVNRAAPVGKRPLRLIGLDRHIDGPSLMMMGIGDVPVKEELPALEKLRLWRLPRLMALMMLRDGAMAREIEKEIFDKQERGIVWIGSLHAATGCRLPGRQRWGQCGLMLRNRYGDRVFGIRLHQMDMPASSMFADIHELPAMASCIEDIMAQNKHNPAGFDLAESPLALLRDRASLEYVSVPQIGLGDIAQGYVYLRDWRDIRHCAWQPGYISAHMFTKHQPMYTAIAKHAGLTARNAEEMNRVFQDMK
jgi:uncharacterized RDD family membrane protein YckC